MNGARQSALAVRLSTRRWRRTSRSSRSPSSSNCPASTSRRPGLAPVGGEQRW